MSKYVTFAIGLVLLAVCAAVQGNITERWGAQPTSDLQQQFADRLELLPKVIGDWDSVEAPVDPEQIKASRVIGHISRTYKNRRTKEEVNIFLVAGAPRHITDHNPDQCYVCQGYLMGGEAERYPIQPDSPGSEAKFFTTTFRKQSTVQDVRSLRIFWGWNHDGRWIAPTLPRWELSDKPALYKLYAITSFSGQNDNLDQSASIKFLRKFIPVMETTLFPENFKADPEPKDNPAA